MDSLLSAPPLHSPARLLAHLGPKAFSLRQEGWETECDHYEDINEKVMMEIHIIIIASFMIIPILSR